MLAMMHVLIRDGLVDDAWVAAHTIGFDELAESRRRLDPGTGGRRPRGLDVADIETLAHDFGTIRPAAIRTLIGAEHHENGAMFFRTLAVPAGARRRLERSRRRARAQRRLVARTP